jgi:hypothetical protein
MGLFDWVDDIFVDPFTYLTTGQSSEDLLGLFKGDEPVPGVAAPTEDQKTTYLKALQKRVADDFRGNKKWLVDQGVANLRSQGQGAIDEAFKNVDADANARGILHSGKRKANRGRAAADIAGRVGQSAGEFEQSVEDQQRDLDNDVISTELSGAFEDAQLKGMTGDDYAKNLSSTLRKRMEKQSAMSQGLNGLGKLGGTLAGGGF